MSVIPTVSRDAKFGALSIGNFDGVHAGHRQLVNDLKRLADSVGGPSVILTFDPPPLRLLKPEVAPAALTTAARKEALLKSLGVDHVVTLSTTQELLNLTAAEFFHGIIVHELQAKALLEGENFHFGRGREGNIQTLKELCLQHKIHFQLARPQQSDGQWISSTRVRDAIQAGEIRQANQWLGRNHRFGGIVCQGSQRGRTIGFPTANLHDIPELVPGYGVYAARVADVEFPQSPTFTPASLVGKTVALHIGPNPTFSEEITKVEAHILDFSGDLYGAYLEIELLQEVRPIERFDSKEALLEQLHRDIQFVKLVATAPPSLSI